MEDKLSEKIRFPRFRRTLNYDEHGVYSYGMQIAKLDVRDRTISVFGKLSLTSAKRYNYAKQYLEDQYDFREQNQS
jgi:hypothetical protein